MYRKRNDPSKFCLLDNRYVVMAMWSETIKGGWGEREKPDRKDGQSSPSPPTPVPGRERSINDFKAILVQPNN